MRRGETSEASKIFIKIYILIVKIPESLVLNIHFT